MNTKEVVEKLKTQYDEQFWEGMKARMEMSFFKYGDLREAYPHKVDAIGSMLVRLIRYLGPELFEFKVKAALTAMPVVEDQPHRRKTGNTEYLIDAANFAMIEFMVPRLKGAHFESTDSDQSPGRMSVHGAVTARPNIEKFTYKRDGD